MNKDIQKTHKRRELKKRFSLLIRPATIKTAFSVLRLIDFAIRVFSKFFP